MEDEKMSKSLGNVVLAEDFIKDNGSSVLRYALISTNYSKPLNFTENLIENSKKEIKKLENAVKKGIEKIIAQDL
jgi:cysteinyl-tRNA synthetase